jgi:hypothetical protein
MGYVNVWIVMVVLTERFAQHPTLVGMMDDPHCVRPTWVLTNEVKVLCR